MDQKKDLLFATDSGEQIARVVKQVVFTQEMKFQDAMHFMDMHWDSILNLNVKRQMPGTGVLTTGHANR